MVEMLGHQIPVPFPTRKVEAAAGAVGLERFTARGAWRRKIRMPGISSLSGCRSRSEKRRVPGMRPRKATCGRDARRINNTSEMIAPISTPFSKPKLKTPANAPTATIYSVRFVCRRCLSVKS